MRSKSWKQNQGLILLPRNLIRYLISALKNLEAKSRFNFVVRELDSLPNIGTPKF